MPRPLRVEFPGALYHVTSRGNDRARIFWDEADRHSFLDGVDAVVTDRAFAVHAYCLMGNHYHLLVETPQANLADGMQMLNSSFARTVNRRYGRTGHLFQGRYHATLVEGESHLLELARYVVLNPVRVGLCDRPEAWRWSSFRATAGLVRSPTFLLVDRILAHFSDDRARARGRYRSFVEEGHGHDAAGPVLRPVVTGARL